LEGSRAAGTIVAGRWLVTFHIVSVGRAVCIGTLRRVHVARTKRRRAEQLMHECNNVPSLFSATLVFSSFAGQYVINLPRMRG
jgi:hypothetical protein